MVDMKSSDRSVGKEQSTAEIENLSFFQRILPTWFYNAFNGSPERRQMMARHRGPNYVDPIERGVKLADDMVDYFAEKVAEKIEEREQKPAYKCNEIAAPSSTPQRQGLEINHL